MEVFYILHPIELLDKVKKSSFKIVSRLLTVDWQKLKISRLNKSKDDLRKRDKYKYF